MKKILMSAAVVTMMLASCTNEELVNQGTDGRMFTLEVTKGTDSRTALDGLQTVWSEGDKIYVTSEDGKTTGVLTLDPRDAGKPSGSFSGYVFGKGELKYSVYPVPTQEGLNLGAADVNKLDAPMTGVINAGTASFVNSCGLVKLNILGLGNDDVVKVSGAEVGSVMEYDLATDSWVKKSAGTTITITGAQDATEFFVPVYTTNTTATDVELSVSVNGGIAQKVTVPVAVKKVNPETPILAVTSTGAVVDPSTADVKDLGDDYIYVSTVEEMRNAIRGEEGPAYVVIKNDEYNITSGDEMEIVRNITIVGESEVILNAVTQGNGWRIFNIYGGSGSLNEEMIVTIKNIVLGDETWTKRGLWIRNDLNGSDKNTNNGCNLTVNLENFQCYRAIVDNGEAVKNENGQMGDNITVKMKNCDIRDFNVQAWKNDKSDTYSYIEFDDASNLGIIVDEQYPLTNIFINGKNPKAHGQQTTYVVKE